MFSIASEMPSSDSEPQTPLLDRVPSYSSLSSSLNSASAGGMKRSRARAKVSWADSVPEGLKPYVELTRIDLFSGSLVMFWPAAWTLTLLARSLNISFVHYIFQLTTFFAWSVTVHSAASTWDDICDMDFDKMVGRTKDRPLAKGTISVEAACFWLVPQVFVTMALIWPLGKLAFGLNIAAAMFLCLPYPYMKRLTYWPQAWLGIAINWGVVLAWVANAEVNWYALIGMMTTCLCWTIYYDSIYAMMDREDDVQAGILSTAVLMGHSLSSLQLFLSSLSSATVLGLLAMGKHFEQPLSYYLITVGGAAVHFSWQLATVEFADEKSCMRCFVSNGAQLGAIVWAGMVLTYMGY